MTDVLPTLIAAWAAFCAAAISPGPNMVAVVSRALGSGRAAGVQVALGIAIGAFLWAMVTALGLGALFAAYPALIRALGLLGGAYLLWLGFKGWRAALTGQGGEIAPAAGGGLWGNIGYGLMVTGTNPKVALFWSALSTFVSGATTALPVLILFASGAATLALVIYGGYGLLFSLAPIRRTYARFSRIAEGLFGTVFSLLGGAMVIRALPGA